jgi:methionyl-tRNA formyltransferase
MKVLFIGQNGEYTMCPLLAVARNHTIVGIVESVPQNYKPVIAGIKKFLEWNQKSQSLLSFSRQISVPYYLLQRGKSQEDLANFVRKQEPDIICVASMSQLLREEVYSIPSYGAINFHPALLPNYRGPRPFLWQYYFMDPQGGATIHYIDQGEDTGDIIKQRSIPIYTGMPNDELAGKIIEAGTELMVEALEDIGKGTVKKVPQKNLQCSFRARHLVKNEQLLQWDWPIERVWHFLRGTSAQTNRILKSLCPGLSWKVNEFRKGSPPGSPGKFRWSFNGCYLTHGEGKIFISSRWSSKDFLRDIYHFLLKLAGKD